MKLWCDLCQCWVDRSELRLISNDAEEIEYHCPGCDSELLRPEKTEDFIKRVERERQADE